MPSCCSTSRAPAAAPTACSTHRPTRHGSTRGSRICDARGVELRLGTRGQGHDRQRRPDRGRDDAGGTVTADYYVAALPVEVMRMLAGPPLRALEPRLAALDRLVTRWMNGVLFYLDRDVPLVHGHAIYVDSEWALTSISQAQFWTRRDLERYGDGRVEGDPVGRRLGLADARPAHRQGRDALHAARRSAPRSGASSPTTSTTGRAVLDERNVLAWFLDPAIEFPNPSDATNAEPLLINTAGSWADRPEATTRIPNLLLAADYVRTYTDLATMEGANEAARRAVNAILDATGSRAPRCEVFTLREPAVLKPARQARRGCAGGCSTGRHGRRCGWRRTAGSSRATCSRAATLAAGAAQSPALTRSRPASRQPASSASSPNACTGPSAPVPRRRLGCAARRPREEAGGQRVRLGARRGAPRRASCRRRRTPRRRSTRSRRPAPGRAAELGDAVAERLAARRARPARASPASRPGSPACSGRASAPNQPR